MRLTNQTVARLSLPEGKTDMIVFDEALPGFGLRLRASGKATWIVQYRAGRQQRRIKLGPLAALDADRARKTAKDVLSNVHLGSDPQAEKIAARARSSVTLDAVTDRYLKRAQTELRPRSFDQVRRHLKLHWAPLKGLPIHQLTRAMVSARLNDLAATSGPVSAIRSRSALSALLSWAMGEGLVDQNVVVGTNKPAKEKSRDRVLTNSELIEVWNACREDQYGRIVKLLILTAQRREEVGGMTRSEVDLDRAIWTIPETRTKNARVHVVPLSTHVIELLREQIAANPDRDLLFGTGEGSFSGWSRAKAALDQRISDARATAARNKRKPADMVHWTLHDLRRTAATRMADSKDTDEADSGLGIAPHVVEAILNHVSGHRAGIAGIYNRASYAAEKRQALDMWGSHVLSLVRNTENNIVSLPPRSAHRTG
jgi:integrase